MRYDDDDDLDDDNFDDGDLDDGYGEDYDVDEDEDNVTIPCPYCRRQIHEDAERCPYCEQYISAEDAPAQAKPWWIVLGVVLCLVVLLWWVVARL
jgi:hypothetical protein